jgi:uncharacterized protein YecE (DUF72 family)
MELFVGTSGFSFAEWKGTFYPADLPAKEMLRYYAERLGTVEINNTFYRMPKRELLAGWSDQVPAGFRFAVKAPQRITHWKRLVDAGDDVAFFLAQIEALGERLGAVLFQLPPHLKRETVEAGVPGEPGRLEKFLPLVTGSPAPVAFEFRHQSWNDPAVGAAVVAAGCAVCASDTDEAPASLVPGARFGYLRLRKSDYDDAALREWAGRVRDQGWERAFVFFKHEEEGRGPRLAKRFLELAA